MESPLDSLIREAKDKNTVSSYLRLFQEYKSLGKHFSAQQTLERCLKKVQLESHPALTSEFIEKLAQIISTHEEVKAEPICSNPQFFIVYSLLGDISLALKKPLDALSYLLNACKTYLVHTTLNQKLLANVVYSGLIECFLSIMLRFLYQKQYSKTMQWKANTDWLISFIKSSPEYSFTSEKLELMIGNYYFILFSWYNKREDFEMCESHVTQLANKEVQFVISYYKNPPLAKEIAKELVLSNPGISSYWLWYSFVESDYSRKINAVNRALQIDNNNWLAWVMLGIIQASKGDFIAAGKTWKIAHHFNHTEPKLWILSSFLYKEARNLSKSIEHFKIGSDLDPSTWINIENYLSTL